MIKRLYTVLSYLFAYLFYAGQKKTAEAFDVIFRGVSNLGGLYVKLVQFVCLRTEIFNDNEKRRFLSFYDAVPQQYQDVHAILMKELGDKKIGEFANISTQPFASGTFGQVYRATLRDGTDVIVKVLRPGLRTKLFFDFIVLKIAATIFNLFHYQRTIDVNKLLREFEELTYKELDYREEVKNAQFFYKAYKHHPYIIIPETFTELSTSKVLVQEYVGGISLTELIENQWRGIDLPYTKDEIDLFIYRMAFVLGIQGFTFNIFYADPHPGNIKLLSDGKFALIDFGIVGASPLNRRTYYHVLELMLDETDSMKMDEIGREFLKWGAGDFYKQVKAFDMYQFTQGKSLATMIADKYASLLESYREEFRQFEEENFTRKYLDIVKAGELLGVKIPPGMLATMRTVVVYNSWVQVLQPGWHNMRGVYRDVLNSVDRKHIVNADDLVPSSMRVEDALEGVFDWISSIAEKDMPWYQLVDREVSHRYV